VKVCCGILTRGSLPLRIQWRDRAGVSPDFPRTNLDSLDWQRLRFEPAGMLRFRMNALGIVAIGTGEGKTLVALGLTRLLSRMGYGVAPFKVGPDYLDASLYAHACGSRARNLDLYLDGEARVRSELHRAIRRESAIVIEGMMGLFDGDDLGETSSAHILAQNDVPAIVVIDGWRMSQSAAAVLAGCAAIAPHVRIAGAILNRCGGESHEHAVRTACERAGFRLLATLPYDAEFSMPERHLGLDVSKLGGIEPMLDRVADVLRAQIDVREFFGEPHLATRATKTAREGPVIAYADDEALSFTYPQTLDALAANANLVPFSPLRDSTLPPGAHGVWLGGGYPELHAEQLAENGSMRAALRDAVESGIPVYAECGGMMLLSRGIETQDGIYPMAGALRIDVSIVQPRLVIGYRDLVADANNVLEEQGERFRAYEFHYASAKSEERPAYRGDGDRGARRANTLAGFIHRRFFEGDPSICRFIERCASS
jgi:cobyrinic acid a,c-diamide synthase